jgi:hypothetical protein
MKGEEGWEGEEKGGSRCRRVELIRAPTFQTKVTPKIDYLVPSPPD